MEETNRIRAELGLAPLRTGPAKEAEAEAVANFKRAREQEVAEQEQAALRERIERAKERRLRSQRGAGASLGESLADEGGMDDAAAWVERLLGPEAPERGMPEQALAEAAATTGYQADHLPYGREECERRRRQRPKLPPGQCASGLGGSAHAAWVVWRASQ